MRRRIGILVAGSALAFALSASPALAGSPAIHFPIDPVGAVVHCGASDYTVVDGYLAGVVHSNDDFASGHETFVARNLMVQKNDGEGTPTGPTYRVVGAETHGATINDAISSGDVELLDDAESSGHGLGEDCGFVGNVFRHEVEVQPVQ